MMHVSPCAWYCFQVPDEDLWEVKDLKDRTWISAHDGSCAIEIVAARRIGNADGDEVSEMHERYLRDEGIQPVKTVLSENRCSVLTYVTRGLGLDEREHIVCHASWKNYCAFIKYHGQQSVDSHLRSRAFYDVVDSLEPLALD